MDDHMLDRLYEEIKLCFMCAESELQEGELLEESKQWKAAKALIKAYNSLVRLYYLPEYVKESLLRSVVIEYRKYKNGGVLDAED